MRLHTMMRDLAVVAAAAALATGCSGANVRYGGEEGVPLRELDLSGAAPTEVALLGPDRVLVTQGGAFAITIDGGEENGEDLRFVLKDGSLGILRAGENWMSRGGMAIVRVTLPEPPRKLSLAGSGELASDRLTGSAEISLAGSGSLRTPQVDADALDVSIAGSGSYRAAGQVGSLGLSIAGSGDARLEDLRAERARVSIAGSGDAVFASDGEVSASIMGSGDVTVRGNARCTVRALGSGTLTCERIDEAG